MRRSTLNAIIALVVIVMALALLVPLLSKVSDWSDAQKVSPDNCDHEKTEIKVTGQTSDYHLYNVVCTECGTVVEKELLAKHTFDDHYVCKTCSYQHEHTFTLTYRTNDNSTHSITRTCAKCGKMEVATENHIYVDGTCTKCYHACATCKLYGRNLRVNGYSLNDAGVPCCIVCGLEFNYCTVDGMILEVWTDDQAYTWFSFSDEYNYTVDGEVVGNESGLVVCHEDGTPVALDEKLVNGGKYIRKSLSHGDLISYIDPDTCNHEDEDGYSTIVSVDRYNVVWKCKKCGRETCG